MSTFGPEVVLGVTACARCGADHQDVPFRELDRPIAPDDTPGIVWSHWAPCPANGQPILLRSTVQ